jgi:hypothetical protein
MHQERRRTPFNRREKGERKSICIELFPSSSDVTLRVCVSPHKESKDLTSYYCVPPTIQISASFTSSDSPIIDIRSERERLLSSVSIPQLIA